MKKKSALIFGLVLVIVLSLGSGMVIGQTSGDLPRVEVACETRAGSFHGFDDGFSILKKCPKGARKVILGSIATGNNDNGGNLNAGNVAFVAYMDENDFVCVLDKNGKVWYLQINEMNSFERRPVGDLPVGISISDVVDWNYKSMVLKNGDVYINGDSGWILAGFNSEE